MCAALMIDGPSWWLNGKRRVGRVKTVLRSNLDKRETKDEELEIIF